MNANSSSYSVLGPRRHSVAKSQNIHSQGPGLREVKSSDEVLAQCRRGPSHGRQFTVANVGNNGRLYLRPITNRSYTPHTLNPAPSIPEATAAGHRASVWSNSQFSYLVDPPDTTSRGPAQTYHHLRRWKSLPTIDDVPPSPTRGALKVVIEGSEPAEKTPPKLPGPARKLEDFRFPERHVSAYRPTPRPPRLSSPISIGKMGGSSVNKSVDKGIGQSVFYKLQEPIEPSIFDDLLPIMHDASVARYSKQTKQLSAATPARIVAQISSESFMDYELVSDFFLTFRSYLSPSNLLSLLLARLEWAINRREDDGRIIRIRVFAALRHWILNYFVDDFVASDSLRAQFCFRINSMYEDLKYRSSRDVSDTKIILDLKRCWNGRCAQYWDDPEFVSDARPEDPIVPGSSKPGSRSNGDGLCFSYSELVAQDTPVGHTRKGSSASVNDFPKSPPPIQAAFNPTSFNTPSSRLSMRGNSVSNQGRGTHILPDPIPELNDPSRLPAPPSPRSPIWRWPLHSHTQSSHSHKRSGSFSDSFRDDRAPLPHSQSNLSVDGGGSAAGLGSLGQIPIETPNSPRGFNFSIIRGSMLTPLEPDVPITRPPSPPPDPSMPRIRPPSSSSFTPPASAAASFSRAESPAKAPAPGVKTFISSLRRVLYNNTSGSNISSSGAVLNKPEPRPIVSAHGKTSLLPPNVVFGSDRYREKRPGIKSASRIDVLCDRAYQSYTVLANQTPLAISTAPRSPSPKSQPRADIPASMPVPNFSRGVSSQITTGSQSIVIVDDTGARVGTSGGLSLLPEEFQMYYPGSGDADPEPEIDPLTPIPLHMPEKDKLGVTPMPAQHENASTSKPASRLRKYASYQSVLGGHGGQRPASDMPRTTKADMGACRGSFLPAHTPVARGMQLPEKRLRRRPGGDLRKMQTTVGSEEQGLNVGPERSLNTFRFASGTTATDSTSSALYITRASHMDSISHSEDDDDDYDEDDIDYSTSSSALDSLSRSGTRSHSSPQPPHARHIFEDAVAGFRKIPDLPDGGIESALLKLEGKWKEGKGSRANNGSPQVDFPSTGRRRSRQGNPDGSANNQYVNIDSDATAYAEPPAVGIPNGTESYLGSDYSYSSIPLLERGLGDESMRTPTVAKFDNPSPLAQNATSNHPSIEVVEKTDSINRIAHGATAPEPVDDMQIRDNVSELSSELSIDDGPSRKASDPTHPLREPAVIASSFHQPTSLPPYHQYLDPSYANQYPDIQPNFPRPRNNSHPSIPPTTPTHSSHSLPSSGHIAFILAHDSQTLAKQFTIVEQAALSEVDWKDLVDMRWTHSCPSPLNWVDYLSAGIDRKGIDMVVARFNLMVKWAVSEIVLTKNIAERALVITKLIHIAVNARKLRNYATMLQVVIALSSVDCTRLVKTWERVPETEKEILAEMESLIQPIRNFHKLRSEMESSVQDGCIPFVGLYVQDLTYNAQKPAQIASTRDGEPLVNFERYHTAAAIVKSLLRLIDASTKYVFEPVPGVLERCLWIAALADDDIKAFSKAIE
ncbi:low temperature essential 1 [Nannizzia gypsea CBS 118893]|uniref:Low temperature essential 1 n=1 Tax=Arthroderma gypseum (strain ATCC MYA-4604 / CBS 118893) TaxID=535722 RepID=E5R2H4_ARTGP|nr:low temperature essential 1 [Nannizzia gypsea CBS 118893]EFQ97850.1 low temperature essential 1 [Nannizzia gypsea CBS 118893]